MISPSQRRASTAHVSIFVQYAYWRPRIPRDTNPLDEHPLSSTLRMKFKCASRMILPASRSVGSSRTLGYVNSFGASVGAAVTYISNGRSGELVSPCIHACYCFTAGKLSVFVKMVSSFLRFGVCVLSFLSLYLPVVLADSNSTWTSSTFNATSTRTPVADDPTPLDFYLDCIKAISELPIDPTPGPHTFVTRNYPDMEPYILPMVVRIGRCQADVRFVDGIRADDCSWNTIHIRMLRIAETAFKQSSLEIFDFVGQRANIEISLGVYTRPPLSSFGPRRTTIPPTPPRSSSPPTS